MTVVRVFVAVITHSHGTDCYVASSQERLQEHVVKEYCELYQTDLDDSSKYPDRGTADDKLAAYFDCDNNQKSYIEYFEDLMELP